MPQTAPEPPPQSPSANWLIGELLKTGVGKTVAIFVTIGILWTGFVAVYVPMTQLDKIAPLATEENIAALQQIVQIVKVLEEAEESQAPAEQLAEGREVSDPATQPQAPSPQSLPAELPSGTIVPFVGNINMVQDPWVPCEESKHLEVSLDGRFLMGTVNKEELEAEEGLSDHRHFISTISPFDDGSFKPDGGSLERRVWLGSEPLNFRFQTGTTSVDRQFAGGVDSVSGIVGGWKLSGIAEVWNRGANQDSLMASGWHSPQVSFKQISDRLPPHTIATQKTDHLPPSVNVYFICKE